MRRKPVRLALLPALLASCLAGCAGNKDEPRIGAGGTGGVYRACGNALAPCLEEAAGAPASARETAGSEGNLQLIANGVLDLAAVQSDTLQDALDGTGNDSEGALSGFSAAASLYTEARQIVAAKSSGIASAADLAG